MTEYWWQDLQDRDNNWTGLEMVIKPGGRSERAMEMVSGHHGRMALQVNGETLYWAAMLEDRSGIWLIYNADGQAQERLLPPVTSADIETCRRAGGDEIVWWCRYFAQRLLASEPALLPARRWLLRPMLYGAEKGGRAVTDSQQWRFSSAASASGGLNWTLSGEEFPDLLCPRKVTLVDWWWRGDRLLARHAVCAESGRLKWWRKKAREGTLPPVLVWYIGGLSSFIIVDGHCRLQAAIAEGMPPRFLVLSELAERTIPSDIAQRERTEKNLAMQLKKNPALDPARFNPLLINLYDNHYYITPTHSRAILGNGDEWLKQVSEYLHKHHLAAYLPNIVSRESKATDSRSEGG